MVRHLLVTPPNKVCEEPPIMTSQGCELPSGHAGGASRLLSLAPQRGTETDISVRAEWAWLAGKEWEFDYGALHSQANMIRRPAGRTQRQEAPRCLPLPAASGSPFLPPQPLPYLAGTEGLPTFCSGTSPEPRPQPGLKAEGRWQRATASFLWSRRPPTSLCPEGPDSSPLRPACASAQAPLLFTLQSSSLCFGLWVIFSSPAWNSL